MKPAATLTISFDPTNMAVWAPLLGGGIGIPTPLGISLRTFLCDGLGMAGDYLDNRVQTILLNSRPVDDVQQTIVADGDVIALSAAMPGLAGATLRRGGHLAAMRAGISQKRPDGTGSTSSTGVVVLKLFNLIAREMGPLVLSREIWLRNKDFEALRRQQIVPASLKTEAGPGDWIAIQPAKPPKAS